MEKFIEGQRVRVAQRENLGKAAKAEKGRFLKVGTVVKEAGNDSYLVREDDERIKKKRYNDIKRIRAK